MNGQSLNVAVTIGIDLRLGVGAGGKWIPGRSSAILSQTEHFSSVVGKALGAVAFVAFANRHIEKIVPTPGEFRAEMNRTLAPGVRDENVANVAERVAFQPPARQRGGVPTVTGLGVCQVQQ